jgi:hypothetical protein
MVPIPKPGKENINDASRYRPINLINVGGKALEKILTPNTPFYIFFNKCTY